MKKLAVFEPTSEKAVAIQRLRSLSAGVVVMKPVETPTPKRVSGERYTPRRQHPKPVFITVEPLPSSRTDRAQVDDDLLRVITSAD